MSEWQPVGALEDKQHCWLYSKDLGVFKGCKIGGGYFVEQAQSHLTGEMFYDEMVGTDEANLDPLLSWKAFETKPPSPEALHDKTHDLTVASDFIWIDSKGEKHILKAGTKLLVAPHPRITE